MEVGHDCKGPEMLQLKILLPFLPLHQAVALRLQQTDQHPDAACEERDSHQERAGFGDVMPRRQRQLGETRWISEFTLFTVASVFGSTGASGPIVLGAGRRR